MVGPGSTATVPSLSELTTCMHGAGLLAAMLTGRLRGKGQIDFLSHYQGVHVRADRQPRPGQVTF